MRVAIDNQPVTDCRMVTAICTVGSTGFIRVQGMSPEEPYLGDEIEVTIEQGPEFPDNDNTVTIRLRKRQLREVVRTINLSALVDLIRDNVDEDGRLMNEGRNMEDDEDDNSDSLD